MHIFFLLIPASPAIASPPGLNTSGVGLSFEELSQLSAAYRPLLQRGCEALVMILAKGCDHCVSENAFSSYTTGMFISHLLS